MAMETTMARSLLPVLLLRATAVVIAASMAGMASLPQLAAQPADLPRNMPPGAALPTGSAAVIAREVLPGRPRGTTSFPDDAVLRRTPDRAGRDGAMLWLRLEGDRYLKIFDEGACAGFGTCLLHRFVAWWPRQQVYVVAVMHGEGSSAYLVGARDGLITRIAAPPVASPAGTHAIAYYPSLLDGPEVEVVAFGAGAPAVQPVDLGHACVTARGSDWLSQHVPVWLDEGRVGFAPADRPAAPGASPVLSIREGKGEWLC